MSGVRMRKGVCKECGKSTMVSSKGYCRECGMKRLSAFHDALRTKDPNNPAYKRWRESLIKGLGGEKE